MAGPFSTSTNAVLTSALTEINAVDIGGTPQAELSVFALEKLNRILDNWNAMRAAIYYEAFEDSFLIIPNQAICTIGPGGDYDMDSRPVTIDGANVILNNVSPEVKTPLDVVRFPWWLTQSVPETTTELPGYLYYEPTWPLGQIRLWPLPTYAYGLEIMSRGLFGALTQFATFDLPPGYWDALVLTLAEDLAGPLRKPWTPTQANKAQQARARVFANNDLTPKIATQDFGMPKAGIKPKPYFNYLTGRPF